MDYFLGLVHEECIAKMNLLSMVDLGSHGSGQIPYELIRDTLWVNLLLFSFYYICFFSTVIEMLQIHFSDDEVEQWVVKEITANLIDCKMNQMNQVVIVRYVYFRLSSLPEDLAATLCGYVSVHMLAVYTCFLLFQKLYSCWPVI